MKLPSVSDVSRHIAARVRQARIMSNPQPAIKDVCNLLSVSEPTYRSYERGTGLLTPEKLWLLSQFYKRPVAWFFEGLPSTRQEPVVEDPLTTLTQSEEGLQMAKAFNKIDSLEVRVRLVELLQAVGR